MMNVVVSVGYERRPLTEFIQALADHGVGRLVDVRELPLSRRAEYRKNALATALAAVGIEYVHVRSAGNPFRKEKADLDACLEAYRGYLTSNPSVIPDVAATLEGVVAFLCYEREHRQCHRSVLVDELLREGYDFDLVAMD